MPDPDSIVSPSIPPVSVALEPAQSVRNSLLLLNWVEKLPGADDWVTRTAAALTPEQRRITSLVMVGLHYATIPDRSWPSFPAYVDHLAAQDPITLRDLIFNAYSQINRSDGCKFCALPDPTDGRMRVDTAPLLASVDAFLEFLGERYPPESIDVEIESEAHRYLNDPPAMRSLIVSHFRNMWDQFLAPEWERVRPMLQDSVDAFRQLDLDNMSRWEAAQVLLGSDMTQEKEELWKTTVEQVERLILVPSAHLGPYFGKARLGDTMWILFGAHIPKGVQMHAPDLSRAEILVRLNALADDTRLRILKLVAEEGEQRSSEIMAKVELSQSAVSRHLKQLSATGYLDERRCEAAKCYTLNPGRIEDALRAISLYLLGK